MVVSVKNMETSKSSTPFSKGSSILNKRLHTLNDDIFDALPFGAFLLAPFFLFTKFWENQRTDAFNNARQNRIARIEEP